MWLLRFIAAVPAVLVAGVVSDVMSAVWRGDVLGMVAVSWRGHLVAGNVAVVPPVARDRSWGFELRVVAAVFGGGSKTSSYSKSIDALSFGSVTPRASMDIPTTPFGQSCKAAGFFTAVLIRR